MKETIALEDPWFGVAVPEDARAGVTDTRDRLGARSLIIWGEHCSECAAPSCYTACSFYTPRADGHCRRFVNGIERVVSNGIAAGSLYRIVFRKWGKLEGRGPVAAIPAKVADERVAHVKAKSLLDNLPILARRAAWNQTQKDRALSAGKADGFDAFVVEGYCPQGQDVAFTLTIVPADKITPALFQAKFVLSKQWSRTLIPFGDIAKQIDLSAEHLIQIEPVGEAQGLEAVFGLLDFVKWAQGKAPAMPTAMKLTPAKTAKVVVWDLDHTVWDGILLEDGASGVTMRKGVREAMEALDARGILQSVASKNNPEEALAAMVHHGFADLMLAPQIGWGPKSASLSRLAQILNLGLDSFVFIDDQPFERGEVSEAHSGVTVLPETAVETLLDRPQFDVPVTPESRGRRALYAIEAKRVLAAADAGSDYDSFLRACDLRLSVELLCGTDVERVYELSQRTNQLNIAATRYTREDVIAIMSHNGGGEGWTMRCTDRFGDYGLIGFALFVPESGEILDFFMSCRVQRKQVEAAFFAWMGKRMARAGAHSMTARWRKAARNGPAVEMFEGLGFSLEKEDDDKGRLHRTSLSDFSGGDIVQIIVPQSELAKAG